MMGLLLLTAAILIVAYAVSRRTWRNEMAPMSAAWRREQEEKTWVDGWRL